MKIVSRFPGVERAKKIARKVQVRVYQGTARLGVPVISPFLAQDAALIQGGFLSTAALAKQAAEVGFTVKNIMSAKVSPSVIIKPGAVIGDGVIISGKNVVIGADTQLSECRISGNNITIGQKNVLRGGVALEQDNIVIGNNNTFTGTKVYPQQGQNTNANLRIGNHNVFGATNIHNETGEEISIGNHNEFGDGAQVRSMIAGWIFVGNHNSIGMDGGGVLSTAYRFNKGWSGPVYVGYGLATKRGAEVLGLGAYGLTPKMVKQSMTMLAGGKPEVSASEAAAIFFKFGKPQQITAYLEVLKKVVTPEDKPGDNTVMLVGVVKPKASMLVGIPTEKGKVKIRDNSRVQHSVVLPGSDIGERTKIYFACVGGRRIAADTEVIKKRSEQGLTAIMETLSADKSGYPSEWTAADFGQG